MKKKIVFLQPKIFEINFRLWSLTAAFYTLCEALQMWVVVSRAARYHAPDPTHATKEVNTNRLVEGICVLT